MAIRNELRQGNSQDLEKRRKIILLSAIGLIDFSIISLYQTGIIKKLPDLPLKIFDTNKVNASEDAYQMGIPDGPVSAGTYAMNMILASAGGSENISRKPVFDVLLAGTVSGNAAGAAYYVYNMIFKQQKICLYCLIGAALNFASAVIIAPVVIKSLKKIIG